MVNKLKIVENTFPPPKLKKSLKPRLWELSRSWADVPAEPPVIGPGSGQHFNFILPHHGIFDGMALSVKIFLKVAFNNINLDDTELKSDPEKLQIALNTELTLGPCN